MIFVSTVIPIRQEETWDLKSERKKENTRKKHDVMIKCLSSKILLNTTTKDKHMSMEEVRLKNNFLKYWLISYKDVFLQLRNKNGILVPLFKIWNPSFIK